ncbi:MAG: hypothetical protein Q8O94_02995 [bacterium]|nr:hypothetical protein [bacterium]
MNITPDWLVAVHHHQWDKRQKGWNIEKKVKYLMEKEYDEARNQMEKRGAGELTKDAEEMMNKTADKIKGKRCSGCGRDYVVGANGVAYCPTCAQKSCEAASIFKDKNDDFWA